MMLCGQVFDFAAQDMNARLDQNRVRHGDPAQREVDPCVSVFHNHSTYSILGERKCVSEPSNGSRDWSAKPVVIVSEWGTGATESGIWRAT